MMRRALGDFAVLHYAAAILVGSFLLFQVQPMIARFILPWFGGSPAVWTTCLLFFQVALLAGYAYAHSLADRVELRRQALVHVALLAASLAALPIVPSLEWKAAAAAGSHPVLVILSLLAGTIGAPYVLLSSTSPLLQHWFERTRPGRSPYRLFALSNLGSLLGLVAYPFVVEPLLRLRAQANLWSAAYALYAGLCAVCAVEVWRRSRGAGAVVAVREPAPGIVLRDRLVWLLLAATGTLMLMATSNHVVQDVASVPFLWVLPLALYLSTLVLCFENERWAVHRLWLAAYALVLPVTVYMLFPQGTTHLANEIVVYSATLFSGCMAVHGELARSRPPAGRLTSFYLHVAAGGALGGAFVTLVAPILLDGYWEFQLALVATWVLAGVGSCARWVGRAPRCADGRRSRGGWAGSRSPWLSASRSPAPVKRRSNRSGTSMASSGWSSGGRVMGASARSTATGSSTGPRSYRGPRRGERAHTTARAVASRWRLSATPRGRPGTRCTSESSASGPGPSPRSRDRGIGCGSTRSTPG